MLKVKKLEGVGQVRKMIIYGLPGIGKSTLASNLYPDKKKLILDFESGTSFIKGDNKTDVLDVSKWFDGEEKGELMTIMAGYDVVIVDTLSSLQEKIIDSLPKAVGNNLLKQASGALTMQGYGVIKSMTEGFFKALNNSGKIIILLAHEKDNEITALDGSSHNLLTPAITGSSKNTITQNVDLIAKIYGEKVKIGKKVEYKRMVVAQDDSALYELKDRSGTFKEPMEVNDFIKKLIKYN